MITYIACPGTVNGRTCGADLYHLAYNDGAEDQRETVRVHCPICQLCIIISLEWDTRPVVTRWRAITETGA